jgi:hypothetical protein
MEKDNNLSLKIKSLTDLYTKGDFKNLQIESLDFLQNIDKNSAQIWNFFALSRKGLGNYDGAKDIYEDLLKKNPNNVLFLANLANICGTLGDIKRQISLLKKVLELDKSMIETKNNLGLAYSNQSQFDLAIETFKSLLEELPNHSLANYNLANAYRKINKLDLAFKYYGLSDVMLAESQRLEILYVNSDKNSFENHYKKMIQDGHINALFASLSVHAGLRYNSDYPNTFCNRPLNCIYKNNINNEVEAEKINDAVIGFVNEKKSDFDPQALLINGNQTHGNIFSNKDKEFQTLKNLIINELDKYKNKLSNSQEGFIRKFPKNFELNGWIIQMDKGGSLMPHIHKEGWISGSIYFKLPKKIKTNDGNIVFTETGPHYPKIDNFNEKIVNISEGDICLFPSSTFHYTIPYESNEQRICLAFDINNKD